MTGEMVPVQTAAFVGVEKPGSSTPLAVSPDKTVLIAGVRAQPYLAESFAIDAKTGQLSHLGNGPLADSMANIAFDRTGKVLFSASYGGNKVAVNPVQASGVVAAPSQVIPTGLNAHAFLPSPDNRFVFATNLGSDQVLGFAFDAATGTLTAKEALTVKTPEKSGPRHFIFHPNGKFIYLLHELNADLAVYGYDADKGLWSEQQRLTTLPAGFTGKPWAADLHLTPDGRLQGRCGQRPADLDRQRADGDAAARLRHRSRRTLSRRRGRGVERHDRLSYRCRQRRAGEDQIICRRQEAELGGVRQPAVIGDSY